MGSGGEMQLVGMLDSAFVRRVAISLLLLDLPFEHRPLSLFTDSEEFWEVNPVIRAPTLVCDNGDVLMDSTLILQYAESLAPPGRSLMPSGAAELQRALRLIGLATAACEKTVQIIYEPSFRP